MPELRFVVSGDQDLKRTIADLRAQGRGIRQEMQLAAKDGAAKLTKELGETRKEADRVQKYLKAIDDEAKRGLTVTIGQARKLFEACGHDVNQFKFALQQAGVKTHDIQILTQQLNKELKESRREAMGLDGNMHRLRDSIKGGVFQAQAMQSAFQRGKEALEAMQRLGKVKGLEDATQDAINLQDKFDELQEKLDLVKDPKKFAEVQKNIGNISLLTNVPQAQLIDATIKAQEAQSAGRELALDNGGALLRQLASTAYADRSEDVPTSIKTAVDMMKGLKINDAQGLRTAQGIIRAGEEKGAITAKDIGAKGGMFITQMAELQGTTQHEALRRGAALFQVMGGAPGINGDFGEANTRLIDLLGKLVDPKTRERLKEATGVDTMTKEGKLREIPDILAEVARTGAVPTTEADLAEAERDPKKKAKYAQFFEIFREKESRQGFLGLLGGRDKIREIEQVDPYAGTRLLEEGFQHRLGSQVGRLDQIARRDEATHLNKLAEKFPAISTTANVVSQTQAEHPYLSAAAGFLGDIAGIVSPKAKLAVEGSMAATAIGLSGTAGSSPRHALVMAEEQARLKQAKEASAKLEKEVAATRAQMEALLRGGNHVNVTVNVQEGMTATVTSDAKSSRSAARSGSRQPKPGQQ